MIANVTIRTIDGKGMITMNAIYTNLSIKAYFIAIQYSGPLYSVTYYEIVFYFVPAFDLQHKIPLSSNRFNLT